MARVLLIDDDRDQLDLRKLIFEHHGHVVSVAFNVEQAETAFHSHAPDCIVMDLRLPKAEDGLALIRAFRGACGFRGRILVLSGFPSDICGTPDESLADRVLTKPVRSDVLLALVDGQITRSV